jgi:hypothetical protein
VTILVDGAVVGTTRADQNGNFTVPIDLPDVEVGPHQVTAQCGRTLTTTIDVVLVSAIDPGSSSAIILLFFILGGAAFAFRRSFL